jgi:hypothetical protein
MSRIVGLVKDPEVDTWDEEGLAASLVLALMEFESGLLKPIRRRVVASPGSLLISPPVSVKESVVSLKVA